MVAAKADTLRTLAYTGTSGSYAAVQTAIAHNWRMFRIINETDGDMLFSLDGTNDNFFVPSYSFVLYDLATNAPPIKVTDELALSVGTIFYVKRTGTAPTQGSVYVEGIYSQGE